MFVKVNFANWNVPVLSCAKSGITSFAQAFNIGNGNSAPDILDMRRFGENVRESACEKRREVLVKQRFHA